MAPLSLLVGILLMVLILTRPAGKPLMSTWGKAGVGLVFALFAAWVVWLGMRSPQSAEELVGQAVACIFFVGIFVVIGTTIRDRREKRRLKNLTSEVPTLPPPIP